MLHQLRLLRLPNLFIIIVTAVAVQINISTGSEDKFSLGIALLMGLAISLLAGAGYVYNDIQDQEADQINNPERRMIGPLVEIADAKKIATGLVVASAVLSIGLMLAYQMYWPVLTLPIGFALLWFYNRFAQSWPLLGNLIIAFLCAIVAPFVAAVGYSLNGLQGTSLDIYINGWIGYYFVFAFALTLYREIQKDLQDMEGDKAVNAQTFPIVAGSQAARLFSGAILLCILVAVCVIGVQMFRSGQPIKAMFLFSFIEVPLIIAFIYGTWGRSPFEYSKASMWSKHSMFMGVIFLVLLKLLKGL